MATLEERYEEIKRKEMELESREQALQKEGIDSDFADPPNFPPFCPVIHHSFSKVNIDFQWACKCSFYFQFIYFFALFVNFLAACGVGAANGSSTSFNVGQNIVFSVLYLVLGIPLAFKFNYMKFYSSLIKKDLGVSWLGLQVVFLALHAYALAGVTDSGLIGFISAIDIYAKTKSGYSRVTALMAAVVWAASLLAQLFMMGVGLRIYKSGDSKVSKALFQ